MITPIAVCFLMLCLGYYLGWRSSGKWYVGRAKKLASMLRKAQWRLSDKYPDPLMKCWFYPGIERDVFAADIIDEEVTNELNEIFASMRRGDGTTVYTLLEGMDKEVQAQYFSQMGMSQSNAHARLYGAAAQCGYNKAEEKARRYLKDVKARRNKQ